jgi:hypothetical protein
MLIAAGYALHEELIMKLLGLLAWLLVVTVVGAIGLALAVEVCRWCM